MPRVTRLGHVGLYVKDPAVMIDFYSNFLGLQVTDRGEDDRIVFLSAQPQVEHHELALVKAPDRKSDVQQISFPVATLEDLQTFWKQIRERGYEVNRVVSHGNAFGCYFRDPEGNQVEVYWQTGREYPQPFGQPIDLDRPADELLAELDQLAPKERQPAAGASAAGRNMARQS